MNPKIWLIGDTHFNHKKVIEYCNRPFRSVEEMNETLIKNWNGCVGKQDIVYMMGDFALCGKDKIIEIGQQLKGRKIIILGNHDGASRDTYFAAGFEYIYKCPIILEEKYILSHIPQKVSGNYINIHAHTHISPDFPRYTLTSFCTSVELNNYSPILFDKIKSYF